MDIINPATDEVITTVEADSSSTVKEKYEQVKRGQKNWAKKSVAERVAHIEKFKNELKENLEEFAQSMMQETGKPISQARGEIQGACKKIDFFLKESEKYLAETEVNVDGNTIEKIAYDPLGVVCNISAWNYPYLIGVNIFIPALICGNAVLYKPSEFSTLTGKHIASSMWKAGIPKDVFQICIGDGSIGKALCDLPLDGYFFTGSYATGKKINEVVAGKLVPVGLELGGKDPLYVTDNVDVKSAAENAAEGCFYNNGQSCCAVERVYVHEKVYDEFIGHFVEATKSSWKMGDPTKDETACGAITRKSHINFLQELSQDAKAKGASALCGDEEHAGAGSFFAPTVFKDVNHEMRLMKEEAFGPIRGIMKVKNDNEAIELMNDTSYGLTAAVFCKDTDRARAILQDVHAGSSYINCCDRVSGYLPWSGRGHSGLGSTLSHLGLYAFCSPRGIHLRS